MSTETVPQHPADSRAISVVSDEIVRPLMLRSGEAALVAKVLAVIGEWVIESRNDIYDHYTVRDLIEGMKLPTDAHVTLTGIAHLLSSMPPPPAQDANVLLTLSQLEADQLSETLRATTRFYAQGGDEPETGRLASEDILNLPTESVELAHGVIFLINRQRPATSS